MNRLRGRGPCRFGDRRAWGRALVTVLAVIALLASVFALVSLLLSDRDSSGQGAAQLSGLAALSEGLRLAKATIFAS